MKPRLRRFLSVLFFFFWIDSVQPGPDRSPAALPSEPPRTLLSGCYWVGWRKMDWRVYIRLLLRRRQEGGGTMWSDACARRANWRGLFSFFLPPLPSSSPTRPLSGCGTNRKPHYIIERLRMHMKRTYGGWGRMLMSGHVHPSRPILS